MNHRNNDLVTIDGLGIHVADDGAGPPVLLMESMGGNWFDFDQITDELAGDFRVVRYDRPGYGLSEPIDAIPTVRAEVRRVVALLDRLGVSEPVIVGAHSVASLYAEALARLHPERVAALVIIDGTVARKDIRMVSRGYRRTQAKVIARVLDSLDLPQRWGPRVRTHMVGVTPPGGYTASQRRAITQVCTQTSFVRALLNEDAGFAGLISDTLEIRRRHPLPPIPVIVQASVSGPLSSLHERQQRWLAQELGASLVTYDDAKHYVVLQFPDRIAGLIRDAHRRRVT